MKTELPREFIDGYIDKSISEYIPAQRILHRIVNDEEFSNKWFTLIFRDILACELKKSRYRVDSEVTIKGYTKTNLSFICNFEPSCCIHITKFNIKFGELPAERKILIKDYICGTCIEKLCQIHAQHKSHLIAEIKLILAHLL